MSTTQNKGGSFRMEYGKQELGVSVVTVRLWLLGGASHPVHAA